MLGFTLISEEVWKENLRKKKISQINAEKRQLYFLKVPQTHKKGRTVSGELCSQMTNLTAVTLLQMSYRTAQYQNTYCPNPTTSIEMLC